MNKNVLIETLQQSLDKLIETVNKAGKELLSGELFLEKNDELRRIKKTLDQYTKKTDDITYIGFIGHFSAGKSSTINNLLNVDNKNLERQTGLHPTDTKITLITHPNNTQNIIGSHRRGELEVGIVYMDIPFLEKYVIIDTPGSGDPTVINELVRDFLPICDKLVYLFSATSPLDKSDLPILKKLKQDLKFIPTNYVISRSNEFKKNINDNLTEKNIDINKKNDFSNQLISRLGSILDEDLSKENLLFIDNIENYGIENLKNKILEKKDINEIHLHKISYFLNQSKEIKDFYKKHLDKQLSDINRISDIVEKNHKVYKSTSTANTIELTDRWRIAQNKLNKMLESVEKKLGEYDEQLKMPKSINDYEIINSFEKDFNDKILYSFNKEIDKIIDEIIKKYEAVYKDQISELLQFIDNINEIKLSDIQDKFFLTNMEHQKIEIPIYYNVDLLIIAINKLISEQINNIEKVLKSNQSISKTNSIDNNINELIEEENKKIKEVLNNFFMQVKIYKVAIIAGSNKSSIERLTLGKMLDKLDDETLPDNERIYLENELINKIHPEFIEKSIKFRAINEDFNNLFNKKYNQLKNDFIDKKNIINISNDNAVNIDISNDHVVNIDISNDISLIYSGIEKEYLNRKDKILSLVSNSKESAIKKIKLKKEAISKSRKKRLIGFLGITFLLIIFYILNYIDFKFVDNWGSVLSVGLVAQTFTSVVFYFIEKLFYEKSNIIKTSIKEINNNEYMHLENNIKNIEFNLSNSIAISKIEIEVKKLIKDHLIKRKDNEKDIILKKYLDEYENLKKLNLDISKLTIEYTSQKNNFISQVNEYYSASDDNKLEIVKISENITEKSIDPALEIFEDRKKIFSSLKEEISNIEFF